MEKRQLPFWLFTIAALLGLTLPVLVQDGMFCDAVLYTCVSRNLSQGIGSFWFPQYSTLNVGGLPSFHEHPPLVFGIESLFFRVLGDHLYVERLYTFFTFAVAIALILRIWKVQFGKQPEVAPYGWAALLLWISSPLVFWSYSNNVQENTLNLFCLSAVLCCLLCYRDTKPRRGYLFLSGLFVFLATLSKGLPGLFPVAVPLIHWLAYRKISLLRAVKDMLLVAAVPVSCYLILLQFPDSRQSLSWYFFNRFLFRVSSMPTAAYRLESLVRTFTELIPAFILIAITGTIAKIRRVPVFKTAQGRSVCFFLLTGAAAILPLMLTMVQKGLYLSPGFPYLAIGLALPVLPAIHDWTSHLATEGRPFRIITGITAALLAGVLVYSYMQTGKISREAEKIRDAYAIGTVVPRNTTITVPSFMYDEYDFVMPGFLMRYDRISISPFKQYDYLLTPKGYPPPDTVHFTRVPLQTRRYDLYRYKP